MVKTINPEIFGLVMNSLSGIDCCSSGGSASGEGFCSGVSARDSLVKFKCSSGFSLVSVLFKRWAS